VSQKPRFIRLSGKLRGMIRRLKSRLAALAGLVLIFTLAACQANDPLELTQAAATSTKTAPTLKPLVSPTPAFTPTTEIPKELTVTAADLEGHEIQFWHPLAGEAAEVLASQVRLFNLSNEWGVRVSLQSTGGTGLLEEAVATAEKSDLPNVVLAPSELLAGWDDADGLMADLTVYLEAETWGLGQAELAGYDSRYWGQDQSGEVQLGLPALRTAAGLIYNRSFAADLGFSEPPATPQELMTQACASAKENNRYYPRYGTGGWMLDTQPIAALSWMSAFGAEVEPQGDDSDWKFNQPEAREALVFLHEMQAAGCVWIPKYPTPYTYMSQRLAFLYTATLQDLVSQQGAMSAANSKDEWALIPFPAKDGKGFVYAYGYSYGVVRSSTDESAADQLAAWLFVRWMSAKDRLVSLAAAWPSLPVRADVRAALEARKGSFPWTIILSLDDAARPAPAQSSWRVVRRPLEDAFWQTFHLSSKEQLETVLPMLDSLATDLLKEP
jgi:multiple sugar transport system substrate-binding protein